MSALSLHVSSDSALFFSFSLSLSLFFRSHRWVGADRESSRLTVPCDQKAVVWLIAAGTASFPFLPFNPGLTAPVTTVLAAGFLPTIRPGGAFRNLQRLCFFTNTSPVYGKSVFISSSAGCLVCLPCIWLRGRIYSSIFIFPARYAAYRAVR